VDRIEELLPTAHVNRIDGHGIIDALAAPNVSEAIVSTSQG
jgi:hypothetical protein